MIPRMAASARKAAVDVETVMLRARDAQKLALAKREVEEMLERAASTIKYRVILALSRRKQGFESPRERQ
jgi:hypothetical protein